MISKYITSRISFYREVVLANINDAGGTLYFALLVPLATVFANLYLKDIGGSHSIIGTVCLTLGVLFIVARLLQLLRVPAQLPVVAAACEAVHSIIPMAGSGLEAAGCDFIKYHPELPDRERGRLIALMENSPGNVLMLLEKDGEASHTPPRVVAVTAVWPLPEAVLDKIKRSELTPGLISPDLIGDSRMNAKSFGLLVPFAAVSAEKTLLGYRRSACLLIHLLNYIRTNTFTAATEGSELNSKATRTGGQIESTTRGAPDERRPLSSQPLPGTAPLQRNAQNCLFHLKSSVMRKHWKELLPAHSPTRNSSMFELTLRPEDFEEFLECENRILRAHVRIRPTPPVVTEGTAPPSRDMTLKEKIAVWLETCWQNYKDNTKGVREFHFPAVIFLIGLFSIDSIIKDTWLKSRSAMFVFLCILALIAFRVITLFMSGNKPLRMPAFRGESYFSLPINSIPILLEVNKLIEKVFGDATVPDEKVIRALERNGLKSMALYANNDGDARPPELVGVASCWPVTKRVYTGMRTGIKPNQHGEPGEIIRDARGNILNKYSESDITPEDILPENRPGHATYIYIPVIVVTPGSAVQRSRRAVALLCEFLSFVRKVYGGENGGERIIFAVGFSKQGAGWAHKLNLQLQSFWPVHFDKELPFFERRFGKDLAAQTLIVENHLLRGFVGMGSRTN